MMMLQNCESLAKKLRSCFVHLHLPNQLLRVTWEVAQELFRPSPSSEPTVVMVEDHEFEEFEEPPVFGKRTVFISRASGGSCSVPEDYSPRDVDSYSVNKDHKKRRTSDSPASKEGEPSGLDALANAAVLGDNLGDMADYSAGATTKHPRHRPGCSCIVCIQPPSGKGKHEPTCKCNVCLTVRRRFKTLMMRKKKRQSEREAELAQEKDTKSCAKREAELEKEDIAGLALLNMNQLENETSSNGNHVDMEETNKGQLDLNCDPHREDEVPGETSGMNMNMDMNLTTLMNSAVFPAVDVYAGQNGMMPTLGPLAQAAAASTENDVADEGGAASGDADREDK